MSRATLADRAGRAVAVLDDLLRVLQDVAPHVGDARGSVAHDRERISGATRSGSPIPRGRDADLDAAWSDSMVSLRQVRDALDAVGCAPPGWRPTRLGLRREGRRRVDLAEATAAVRLLQAGLLRAHDLRANGRWPERGDDHLVRACRLASDALARWPRDVLRDPRPAMRRLDPDCVVCGRRRQKADSRCSACYEHRRLHGVDRPRHLWAVAA